MSQNEEKKRLRVSTGLVFRDGQLLINQRTSDRIQSGYWEFPGGKIELGETPEQALVRELKEEVNIEVQESLHLLSFSYEYSTHYVDLEIFKVLSFLGVPSSNEDQAIAWVSREQLITYNLLEANRGILHHLYAVWPK